MVLFSVYTQNFRVVYEIPGKVINEKELRVLQIIPISSTTYKTIIHSLEARTRF